MFQSIVSFSAEIDVFSYLLRPNCITECYLKHASEFCNCAPWDYPVPDDFKWPICDFYGSSCFTSYIENGLAEQCRADCLPGCNEIKYTVSSERELIDWNTLCSYDPKARTNTIGLFDIEAVNLVKNASLVSNEAILQFQQVLLNVTDAHSFEMRFCKETFQFDIAMVEVIMESPTVIKYIQTLRVSITDKLANFGKHLCF